MSRLRTAACSLTLLLATASQAAAAGGVTFFPPVTYAAHSLPSGVAIGALRGGNYPDVVVANTLSNDVSVLRSNRDGTFAAPQNYSTGTGLGGPITVSIASTAFLPPDIAFADNFDSVVGVLRNQGDGTFGVPATWIFANPRFFTFAYTEGDPVPDVYAGGAGTSGVYWWPNTCCNFPNPPVSGWTGPFPSGASVASGGVVAVVDGSFTSSGNDDLAMASTGTTVTLAPGDGAGHFSAGTTITFPVGSLTGIASADFNGDGIADIAVSSSSGDACVALLNGAGGTKAPPTCYSLPGNPEGIAAGDVTGDGNADIVTANGADHSISVLAGDGHGGFAAPVRLATASTSSPWSVAIGDLRAIGATDIVTADRNNPGTVSVFLAAPAPAVAPSQLSFGEQDGLIASSPQTVMVSNNGAAPLTVRSAIVSGQNQDSFTYSSSCGSPVKTGASCAVSVAFRPFGLGSLNATLDIDTGAGGVFHVPLSGIGVIPGPPRISHLTVSPKRVVHGHQFSISFVISRSATLAVAILRQSTGHRVGHRCVRGAPRKHHHQRPCLISTVMRQLAGNASLGANTVPLLTGTGKHGLGKGTYRLVVVATASLGRRSAPAALALVVH